jgi:hypothetical protein
MLKFILGLDLVIYKKCAELGAIFFLGAFEGAVIYAMLIMLGIVIVLRAKGIIEVKNK